MFSPIECQEQGGKAPQLHNHNHLQVLTPLNHISIPSLSVRARSIKTSPLLDYGFITRSLGNVGQI